MGLRRFQCRFRHSALGPHCRLAGKQVGKGRLCIARARFEVGELARHPRGFAFAVGKPLFDGDALFLELADGVRRILLERPLAADVLGR